MPLVIASKALALSSFDSGEEVNLGNQAKTAILEAMDATQPFMTDRQREKRNDIAAKVREKVSLADWIAIASFIVSLFFGILSMIPDRRTAEAIEQNRTIIEQNAAILERGLVIIEQNDREYELRLYEIDLLEAIANSLVQSDGDPAYLERAVEKPANLEHPESNQGSGDGYSGKDSSQE